MADLMLSVMVAFAEIEREPHRESWRLVGLS
ncbi:hypothetical protein BLA23254_07832 [Burkholderia lata]|uniref:Uncharacterized protein n=1 Tax=Burkholderia lata (strain ATCC 17760 / DSM 23089 / LMG 22485 / NCIMB 9086 / R18194 / 383) TaxID=482957 RepID=A0A6P2SJZ7_BURL3|nr:hypothetical protein BLA23254_07832 [Burkholderia lata]